MEKAQGQYGAGFTAAKTALNGLLCETDGRYGDGNGSGFISYRNLKHTITSMTEANLSREARFIKSRNRDCL